MKSRFVDIKKMLSRDEMKLVKGGSGGWGDPGPDSCPGGSPMYICSYPGASDWTTSCCHGRTPNYISGTTCYQSGVVPAGGGFSNGSYC
ncbi:MAG: hypothetical protein JWR12_172 [Mucilaginibacter sp.]|nr:hypothetical protein [Mucilaginibacter sp.]